MLWTIPRVLQIFPNLVINFFFYLYQTLPRLLDAPSLENMHVKVVSCGARHTAVVTGTARIDFSKNFFPAKHTVFSPAKRTMCRCSVNWCGDVLANQTKIKVTNECQYTIKVIPILKSAPKCSQTDNWLSEFDNAKMIFAVELFPPLNLFQRLICRCHESLFVIVFRREPFLFHRKLDGFQLMTS